MCNTATDLQVHVFLVIGYLLDMSSSVLAYFHSHCEGEMLRIIHEGNRHRCQKHVNFARHFRDTFFVF